MHRHAGGPDRVAFGFQPARGIDGERAILLGQAVPDRARALAFRHEPHGFIFDEFRYGETVVGFHEGEIGELDAGRRKRPRPGLATALEFEDVALRHRQEILHMAGGTEDHGRFHGQRGLDIGKHQSSRAVGNSEQSVRFNGPATNGFFSLSRRQKSKPRSLRICA